MLRRVAILYHPRRKKAVVQAEWLSIELSRRGVETQLGNGWNQEDVLRIGCDADLIVALGGDGTIIHIAGLTAPVGVPLLGVNLGRVGFLAELTPEAMSDQVDQLADGAFWLERHTMLDVEWRDDVTVDTFLCLNEVAMARGVSPRAVLVNTLLDGEEFMTYTADAVLVATATGSTAYSLAAGGPILYPESKDFMITPVAPHLHIGRSVIVPCETRVTLTVVSDRPAVMSIDGAVDRELKPHHTVKVQTSQTVATFARFGPRKYFYQALADRLR